MRSIHPWMARGAAILRLLLMDIVDRSFTLVKVYYGRWYFFRKGVNGLLQFTRIVHTF